ncbi:hypothetical protein T07_10251 [Trichinella nelsoni]|uniref:Uncharacterized protein n=1 Tax=Trichinella nelsoni TaxID=6336 RepID=A0A0V0S059_9BILA|nr:hypothetical protein T07_10251 [Trichinella nelsoni]
MPALTTSACCEKPNRNSDSQVMPLRQPLCRNDGVGMQVTSSSARSAELRVLTRYKCG